MKQTLSMLFVLLALGTTAMAQPFGAGLKVGAPLTDAFKIQRDPSFAAFTADAPRYTVGPYVEVRLPFQLSVEADALYRPYNFSNAGIGTSNSSWEIPVVLKHPLLRGPVKPYFEGGVAWSRLTDIKATFVNHEDNFGVVVGGGVQINLLLFKVSPEIRYNGWGLRNFDGLVQSNRNQLTFLVGFGF